jgi:hypothetical protein
MKETPGSLQTGPDSDRNRDDDPLRERHGETPQPDSANDIGVGATEDDDEFEDDEEDLDEDEAESDVDES